MDFEQEEDGTIIIDGTHIIEFEESKGGDINWENQGTTTFPKPKIVSVEIVDKTETSITVQVTTKRNIGGTLTYYIQEEGEEYQKIEEKAQTATDEPAVEPEYEFTIDQNKVYSKIKVEAKAENGETASKEIDVVTIPTLTKNNVKFIYKDIDGKEISEDKYTKGPVTVQASTKNIDMTGYILQYTTGNPEVESNWKEYKTGVEFRTNGSIYLRLSDGEEAGRYMTGMIRNIDTKEPNTFTPTVENSDITTNSMTVKGKTTDATEAEETAGSGIAKYYFGIEEGTGKAANWEPTWLPTNGQAVEGENKASYQFEGLKHNTTYSIRMKAVDKVGQERKSEIITVTTATVPGGTDHIGISYSNTNWTNTPVEVTITNKTGSNAYKLQYSRDNGTNWNDYTDKLTFDTNGSVVARLTDNKNSGQTGNVGGVVNGSVMKIDKTVPSISTATPLTATNTTINSIALKIKATDTNSGLGKIKWYYKKSTDGSYTSVEDVYQASGATAGATTEQEKTKLLTGLTVGTDYNLYVEVYDVAGNMATSSTITARTKRQYTVTYNAVGGTGAPGNQTKTEGTDLTLSAQVPTKSGYAFKGWDNWTAATKAWFQPGDRYTTDADLNLYAVWEAVPTEVELKDASDAVKQAHNFYGSVTQSTPAYGSTNLSLSNVPNLAIGQIVYVSNTAEFHGDAINAGYYKITGKSSYPTCWTYESLGTSYKVQQ